MTDILDIFTGGHKPQAPAPLDAAKASAEQGAANLKAAQQTATINRPDQITPYGSLKWSQGGSNFNQGNYDAATKAWQDAGASGNAPTKEQFGYDPNAWASTITLTPENQTLLTQELQNRLKRGNLASQQIDSAAGALAAPMQVDSPRWIDTYAKGRYADITPTITQNVANSGQQAATGRAGMVDALSGVAGIDTTGLSYKDAPAMPTADNATRQAVADAYYRQSTSRLDPQWAQADEALRSRLANQGITEGSEAYGKEIGNFDRAKNDAYGSAINSSIMNSTSEMEKLFSMGMSARQQGVAEANNLFEMPLQAQLAKYSLLGSLGQNLDASGRNWSTTGLAAQQAIDATGRTASDITAQGNLSATNARAQLLREYLGMQAGAGQIDPSFSSSTNVAQVTGDPILDALLAQYQGQLGVYNSKMDARNSLTQAIAGAAGALIPK